jgi:hypothetical protein
MGVCNDLPLPAQIRQSGSADILRLIGHALRIPDSSATPRQAVCARQKLLSLIQLRIASSLLVVSVPGAEERLAVGRETGKLALQAIDVGLMVAEAGVGGGFAGRGNVLLLDAHLVKLWLKEG